MNVRFEETSGHDADETRCLLMTHSGLSCLCPDRLTMPRAHGKQPSALLIRKLKACPIFSQLSGRNSFCFRFVPFNRRWRAIVYRAIRFNISTLRARSAGVISSRTGKNNWCLGIGYRFGFLPLGAGARLTSRKHNRLVVEFPGEQNRESTRGNRERYISQWEIQILRFSRRADVSNSSADFCF